MSKLVLIIAMAIFIQGCKQTSIDYKKPTEINLTSYSTPNPTHPPISEPGPDPTSVPGPTQPTPTQNADHGGYSDSLIVDSFEYDEIPVTRTSSKGDRLLWWNNTAKNRNGVLGLNKTISLFGLHSLSYIIDEDPNSIYGGMQLSFYNNWQAVGNDWKYLHETVEGYDDFNKYNRLRFWIKLPPTTVKNSNIGSTNFHVGTYLRDGNTSVTKNESDNYHFYHYYNLEHTDNWQQVIVDPHPNHQRSHDGNSEHGVITEPEPITDPGKNYFDLMTYFYIDLKSYGINGPGTILIDGIEIFEEPYNEDIDHIYSLTGVHSKLTDEIIVGWKRNKNENDKLFDVKYAFTSFHENGGWIHGTNAPNGQNIDPPSSGGYNGVEYRTNQINLAGKSAIYIAIKHQDENQLFRQIRIPLNNTAYPPIGGF